tara:strand:+ start:147 stop:743 length:597 start_codon:yes stop_codon:yes gene_type:complete
MRHHPVKYESGKYGEQAFDLFSWLALYRKKIFINDIIDDDLANILIGQMYALSSEATHEIEFIINSPGGSVYAMNCILDAMDMMKEKFTVKTKVAGTAFSAAAIILTNGTLGHRSATPRSRIMFHDISSGGTGKFTDLEASLEETRHLRDSISDTIKYNTLITDENVKEFMSTDRYIGAEEAMELSIIDKISNTIDQY